MRSTDIAGLQTQTHIHFVNTSFLNHGITAVFENILKKATVTIVIVTMVTVEKLFFSMVGPMTT